ncbi:hypothetical protein ACHAXS_006217 [Conticribra weissflogii]
MNVEAMYPDNFHDSFEDWAQTIDHNMEYLAYKAVEFIEDNANNDFFLYFNPTAPHIPDIVTALTKDCRATVDGDFTDSMTTGWSVEGMTKEFGDDCSAYREDVKARAAQSTSSDDLGSIWVDDAIGAIYKALERTNQLNDTVILFQLDHGMKEKDLIWEGGIRIPQFIHYPNGFGTTPRTWDGLVSTIDIGPTFLDIAGIDETYVHRYSMDGKSWKDAVNKINGIGDDWKRNHCLFFESNQERAVRCGCDKYITLSSTSVEKSDAVARGFTGWDSNTNVTLVNLCDSSDHYIDADPSATSLKAENVTGLEPQKASDLASLLQCHLDKTNANNASPLYQECIGDIATPAPNLRGTSPPTPAPVQDITAPLVNSLTPEDGSFTALTLATLHVTVSDESSIRNVAFQLRKPDDSILAFEEGIIVETNADGSEKWEKDVTLDMSGQWQWRARIVDNSPNRNIFVTDWTELLVLGGVSPIEDVVDMIKSEIEALILDNPVLRPKFLRLGFHDCVGKLMLSNESNHHFSTHCTPFVQRVIL